MGARLRLLLTLYLSNDSTVHSCWWFFGIIRWPQYRYSANVAGIEHNTCFISIFICSRSRMISMQSLPRVGSNEDWLVHSCHSRLLPMLFAFQIYKLLYMEEIPFFSSCMYSIPHDSGCYHEPCDSSSENVCCWPDRWSMLQAAQYSYLFVDLNGGIHDIWAAAFAVLLYLLALFVDGGVLHPSVDLIGTRTRRWLGRPHF